MGREQCTTADYARALCGADRFAFYNQLHVLLMEELNKALNKIFAPVSDATELPDDAGRSSPHAPSRCTRTEPMHTHTHRYSRVRMRRHTRCANMSIQCTGRHGHSVPQCRRR